MNSNTSTSIHSQLLAVRARLRDDYQHQLNRLDLHSLSATDRKVAKNTIKKHKKAFERQMQHAAERVLNEHQDLINQYQAEQRQANHTKIALGIGLSILTLLAIGACIAVPLLTPLLSTMAMLMIESLLIPLVVFAITITAKEGFDYYKKITSTPMNDSVEQSIQFEKSDLKEQMQSDYRSLQSLVTQLSNAGQPQAKAKSRYDLDHARGMHQDINHTYLTNRGKPHIKHRMRQAFNVCSNKQSMCLTPG